jgi:AcrR family transcriptional regulator
MTKKAKKHAGAAPPLPVPASPPGQVVLDERVRRSKELILRTTSELLIEHGMSGVSVDEVSRRSGVAKTTIYRHWRSRTDLVLEAAALISTVQQTADSGNIEGDLTSLLLDLASSLRTASWPLVLPSIVDAAERDPELAAMYSQKQIKHGAPYVTVIERAKKKGLVSAKADTSALVAQLVGPLFYRRWFSREPLDEKFVKSIVRGVIAKS